MLRRSRCTKSQKIHTHHACSSFCCRCPARLCRRSHPPGRPHYREHLRCHRRRSRPQQPPPLAVLDQLRQVQVLRVRVSNHLHRLLSTRPHPSCSATLDQYLLVDSVTRAAVDAVGLATVKSYVAAKVRLFCQSPFRRSNPPPAPHLLIPPRHLLRPPRTQLRPMPPRGRQRRRRSQRQPQRWTKPWLVAQGEGRHVPQQRRRFARRHFPRRQD